MKKKRIVLIGFVVVIALILLAVLVLNRLGFSVFGIFAEKTDINALDSERLLSIKQAYLDMRQETGYPESMTTDDVYLEEYCGSYHGCEVVMLTDNETAYAQAVQIVKVAGVRICYRDANELYAWKDGKIYTLNQAYQEGFLKRSDIRKIRDIHNLYG